MKLKTPENRYAFYVAVAIWGLLIAITIDTFAFKASAQSTVITRLRQLLDVRLAASPTVNDALIWNGTQWTNGAVSGATALTNRNNTFTLMVTNGGVKTLSAGTGVTFNDSDTNVAINASSSIPTFYQTLKSDTFSTASTSFTDITGLSISITNSSALTKVLVRVSLYVSGNTSAGNRSYFRLTRNGTAIGVGDAAGSRRQVARESFSVNQNVATEVTWEILDSPAVTTNVTYQVQMAVEGGTGYINRSSTDTDTASFSRGISTITITPSN